MTLRDFLLSLPLLLCLPMAVGAQTPEINVHKYWNHRHRLLGDGSPENPGFVKVVDDPANSPGSMIPVSSLLPYADCQRNFFLGQSRDRCQIGDQGLGGVIGGADGTIHLGWYIGMLAMEYRLLDMTGQPEEALDTAEELWKALEAYERLDSTAETKYGFPGVVDGFFLRDDTPHDFYAQLDENGNPNFPGYSCFVGPQVCNQDREGTEAYSNVPSPDQINYLMLGAALVKACLPPDKVKIRGEDVRFKAQHMVHLMISRLRNDRWYIRSPFGTKVPVGPQLWMYSYPLAEAANFITENNTELGFQSNYHDVISAVAGGMCWNAIRDLYATQPPIDICLSNLPGGLQMIADLVSDQVDGSNLDDICWNLKNPVFLTQTLTMATMSNTFPPEQLAFISYINGLEIYPILQSILFGTPVDEDIIRSAFRLVDVAPCEKFCWLRGGDPDPLPYEEIPTNQYFSCDNVVDWISTDRWGHPKRAEDGGDREEISSLKSGLDFLALYNALHLVRPNRIANGYRDSDGQSLTVDGEFPRQVTTAFGCSGCLDRPAIYYHEDSIVFNAKVRVLQDAQGNSVPGAVYLLSGGVVVFGPDFEAEAGSLVQIVYGNLRCDTAVFSYPLSMPDTEGEVVLNDLTAEEQLVVFPNPSGGLFHLETAGEAWEDIRVDVVDPAGRVLFESGAMREYRLDIDLRDRAAGLYYLRVHWGNRVFMRKLVVVR